jgi:predicted transcriptional regulator
MQYLRDTTAMDYLRDSLHIPYEQADQLLHVLIEEGFLEYDQFGAFPGTTIGEKGKHFLKDHEK